MPIWNQNPFYTESGFSGPTPGVTPLGPSANGGRGDPEDPPESGAPENAADGGVNFSFDPDDYDFDPDLDYLANEYARLYGSKPPASLYDPPEVDYGPIERAMQQASARRRESFQEAQENAQEQVQRQQFQTLWNVLGPGVFEVFTGAGTNTGIQEQMRMTQQARQRAAQIERELGIREGEMDAERLRREAELQVEEQQTNQQREREADRQQYEDEQERRAGMLGAAQTLMQAQGERDAAEAELAVEQETQQQEYQEQLRQDTVDLIADLDDDPQLAPQVAAQVQALNPDLSDREVKAKVGQLLRASQQGQLNPEEAASQITSGGASNPLSQTESLVTKTLQLKGEYDESDGWLWGRDEERPASSTASGRQGNYINDLESRRQALVYQLGRAANAAEKRAYELQKTGVDVPNETLNQIAALNTAREKLNDMTVEAGEDADAMENILAPVSTSLSTLTAGASQPQSDPLRANPATAPYIAAFEGDGAQRTQQAQGEAQSSPPAQEDDIVTTEVQQAREDERLRPYVAEGEASPQDDDQGAEARISAYEARLEEPVERVTVSPDRLKRMTAEEARALQDRLNTGTAVVVLGENVEDAEPGDVVFSSDDLATMHQQLRNEYLRESTGSSMTSDAIEAVGGALEAGSAQMAQRRLRQYGIDDVQPGDTAKVIEKPDGSYLIRILGTGGSERGSFSVPDAATARRIRDEDVPRAAQASN